ncbi:hypothetical protein HanIR_Chr11g0537471 [Helianthus annuus]|nr:hypothetical protein HanIR_Chr11g0537471 [Helianthus annuus]
MESTNFGYLWSCEKGTQEISVCDEHLKMNPDSFQVDMEAFSHLTTKDATFNSRFHVSFDLGALYSIFLYIYLTYIYIYTHTCARDKPVFS